MFRFSNDQNENIINILVTGPSFSGKTRLVCKILHIFYPEAGCQRAVVGPPKSIYHNGKKWKCNVIDDSDYCISVRKNCMTQALAKKANVVVVCLDVTRNSAGPYSCDDFIQCVREVNEDVPVVLFGTKIDDYSNRKISYEEGVKLAKEWQAYKYIEGSAKYGIQEVVLNEIFELGMKDFDIKLINKAFSDTSSISSYNTVRSVLDTPAKKLDSTLPPNSTFYSTRYLPSYRKCNFSIKGNVLIIIGEGHYGRVDILAKEIIDENSIPLLEKYEKYFLSAWCEELNLENVVLNSNICNFINKLSGCAKITKLCLINCSINKMKLDDSVYTKDQICEVNLKGIAIDKNVCDFIILLGMFAIINELDFSSRNMKNVTVKNIFALMHNKPLRIIKLNLNNNLITYSGARDIAESFTKWSNLKNIDLSANRIICNSSGMADKLWETFSKYQSLEKINISQNFFAEYCTLSRFFYTTPKPINSLLTCGEIYTNDWIVGFVCNKGTEHAMIYLEGMYENGQRFLERYHITAEHCIGHALIENDQFNNLDTFTSERFYIVPRKISSSKGRLLQTLINADKGQKQEFSKYYPTCTNGKINCVEWCRTKLKQIEVEIEEGLFGLPSFTAQQQYCHIL